VSQKLAEGLKLGGGGVARGPRKGNVFLHEPIYSMGLTGGVCLPTGARIKKEGIYSTEKDLKKGNTTKKNKNKQILLEPSQGSS